MREQEKLGGGGTDWIAEHRVLMAWAPDTLLRLTKPLLTILHTHHFIFPTTFSFLMQSCGMQHSVIATTCIAKLRIIASKTLLVT
jgi:hypothetical protein